MKRYMLFLVLILASAPAQVGSALRYAAPYGAGATCDESQPCPLSTALAQGGEIWLQPGTYHGDLTIGVPNTFLRSVPGARARIDGGVIVSGAGVTLQGLEIFDGSWTDRTQATVAQNARHIDVLAPGVTLRDNIIHDLAGGIYAFNGAGGASSGLLVEHNLLYNIGYGASLGRGTGHAVYTQNDGVAGKEFRGNIFADQYGFNMHAYGSSSPYAKLDHLTFSGNVSLNNRWLTGGGQPLRDVRITDNRLWKSRLQVGYGSLANEDVTVTGNWIGAEALQMLGVVTPTVRLNRVAAPDVALIYNPPPGGVRAADWTANTYYRMDGGGYVADVYGQGFKTLPQWRAATGFDATSTLTQTVPAENWIDVQPWGAHRGVVTAFNWTQQQTVTLDLSPLGLTPGASYRLINAQNPAEQQTFVAGAPLAVPTSGWSVATPYGAAAPLASWDARFGAWLVEPAP